MLPFIIIFILGAMVGACALTAVCNFVERIFDWVPPAAWALALTAIAVVVAIKAR